MSKRVSKRTRESENQDISCPICLDYFSIPVYQCPKGHPICLDCYQKLTTFKCPFCRIDFPQEPKRDLHTEKKLKKIPSKCRFSPQGCKEKLSLANRREHQLLCEFNRIVKCPILDEKDYTRCGWEDQIDNLLAHLQAPSHNLKVDISSKSAARVNWGHVTGVYPEIMIFKKKVLKVKEKCAIALLLTAFEHFELVVIPLALNKTQVRLDIGEDTKIPYSCKKFTLGLRHPFAYEAVFKLSTEEVEFYQKALDFKVNISLGQ